MTAEIHFCDLCNESVPQIDLDTGRAFLRKGRVVCRRCDELMSAAGHGEPVGARFPTGTPLGAVPHGAPLSALDGPGGSAAAMTAQAAAAAGPLLGSFPSAPSAASTPSTAPSAGPFSSPSSFAGATPAAIGTHSTHAHAPHVAPRQRGGNGVALGLLALLGLVGLGIWSRDELARARSEGKGVEIGLRTEVEALRGQLQQSLGDQRGELSLVSKEVDRQLAEQRDAIQKGLGASEQMAKTSTERLGEFERRLETMKESVGTIQRHDAELVSLQQKLAAAQAALEDLRAKLAEGVRTAASPAAVPPQAPAGPAWQPLVKDLASPDAATRWQAVVSLGETRDPAVVTHLLPMLSDADLFVKMAAARKLGDLGSLSAVDALIDTLEDPESGVRSAALAALQTLTKKDFGFDANDPDPAERARRVKAWREWWGKEKPKAAS
jgi:hypothetical protein